MCARMYLSWDFQARLHYIDYLIFIDIYILSGWENLRAVWLVWVSSDCMKWLRFGFMKIRGVVLVVCCWKYTKKELLMICTVLYCENLCSFLLWCVRGVCFILVVRLRATLAAGIMVTHKKHTKPSDCTKGARHWLYCVVWSSEIWCKYSIAVVWTF